MLAHTSIRVKQPLEAGGRGQDIVTTLDELDPLLERLPASNIATYGLVLEQNLHQVTTLSIGHITVDDVTFTYHGRQRVTRNNAGHPAYGAPISSAFAAGGTLSLGCRCAERFEPLSPKRGPTTRR